MKPQLYIRLFILQIMGLISISCQENDMEHENNERVNHSEEIDNNQAHLGDIDDSTTPRYKITPAPKLYDEFLNLPAPKELSIPPDERGWGAWQQIYWSKKYNIASAIMESGDKATLAKIWREFPSLSETDQFMISLAAYSSNDINQVAAIASLAPSAKSKEIRSQLIRAAKTIIVHALRDPKRSAAAKPIAEQLISSGFAPKLLKNEIKKLEQK